MVSEPSSDALCLSLPQEYEVACPILDELPTTDRAGRQVVAVPATTDQAMAVARALLLPNPSLREQCENALELYFKQIAKEEEMARAVISEHTNRAARSAKQEAEDAQRFAMLEVQLNTEKNKVSQLARQFEDHRRDAEKALNEVLKLIDDVWAKQVAAKLIAGGGEGDLIKLLSLRHVHKMVCPSVPMHALPQHDIVERFERFFSPEVGQTSGQVKQKLSAILQDAVLGMEQNTQLEARLRCLATTVVLAAGNGDVREAETSAIEEEALAQMPGISASAKQMRQMRQLNDDAEEFIRKKMESPSKQLEDLVAVHFGKQVLSQTTRRVADMESEWSAVNGAFTPSIRVNQVYRSYVEARNRCWRFKGVDVRPLIDNLAYLLTIVCVVLALVFYRLYSNKCAQFEAAELQAAKALELSRAELELSHTEIQSLGAKLRVLQEASSKSGSCLMSYLPAGILN